MNQLLSDLIFTWSFWFANKPQSSHHPQEKVSSRVNIIYHIKASFSAVYSDFLYSRPIIPRSWQSRLSTAATPLVPPACLSPLPPRPWSLHCLISHTEPLPVKRCAITTHLWRRESVMLHLLEVLPTVIPPDSAFLAPYHALSCYIKALPIMLFLLFLNGLPTRAIRSHKVLLFQVSLPKIGENVYDQMIPTGFNHSWVSPTFQHLLLHCSGKSKFSLENLFLSTKRELMKSTPWNPKHRIS